MKRTKGKSKQGNVAHRVGDDSTSETKFVWVYGSYQPIINRAAVAMINHEDKNYDFYRVKLGMGMDELFIPVWWNIRNRAQTIKDLMELNIGHLLLVGNTSDTENEEIQELYKNGKAIFIMPEELNYHEANLGTEGTPAWHEVKTERDRWHSFLKKHFENNWQEIT